MDGYIWPAHQTSDRLLIYTCFCTPALNILGLSLHTGTVLTPNCFSAGTPQQALTTTHKIAIADTSTDHVMCSVGTTPSSGNGTFCIVSECPLRHARCNLNVWKGSADSWPQCCSLAGLPFQALQWLPQNRTRWKSGLTYFGECDFNRYPTTWVLACIQAAAHATQTAQLHCYVT